MTALAATPTPKPAAQPKLIVAIIIDQFRYDYLTRFAGDYNGGLHQLITHGANFTNAFYAQVPTVTAVGHSIFLSGAMPAVSGIVGNSWYDREEGRIVTSVCDSKEQSLGGGRPPKKERCNDSDPASPRRLTVSTVGDELMLVSPTSKVVGVSIKARGAILPSGHRAAGAYWFDDDSGYFVSSTYYGQSMPSWVGAFNAQNLAAKYVKRAWEGFPGWSFKAAKESDPAYGKIPYSPWGNELIEGFAEQAFYGERLGQRGVTDLLTVSFSSNDYVGHLAGPDSPEVHDMAIRVDRLLGKLFAAIDDKAGLQNTLIVLSADHGVAPTPAQSEKDKMPGGYLPSPGVEETVTAALSQRFGKAEWLIPSGSETALYLNYEVMPRANWSEVFAVARQALLGAPQLHVARVYSRDQMDAGITGDFIASAVNNGYYPRRSGDLTVIFEPNYMSGASGTTHFSPYAYDRHVPVLFMGPGIRAGRYAQTIMPNDIAPTLATMLALQTPSGSSGRVLSEMLNQSLK